MYSYITQNDLLLFVVTKGLQCNSIDGIKELIPIHKCECKLIKFRKTNKPLCSIRK